MLSTAEVKLAPESTNLLDVVLVVVPDVISSPSAPSVPPIVVVATYIVYPVVIVAPMFVTPNGSFPNI